DQERLAAWTGTLTAMAATLSQEWQQAGTDTVARQQAASDTLAQTARDIAAQTQAQAGLLDSVSARLETAAGSVTQAWTEAQARQEQVYAKLAGDNQQALETAAATFEQHSAALLQTLDQSHTQLQAALASRDQERLAAWKKKTKDPDIRKLEALPLRFCETGFLSRQRPDCGIPMLAPSGAALRIPPSGHRLTASAHERGPKPMHQATASRGCPEPSEAQPHWGEHRNGAG
ncbi:DUF802 domain-containing protein, partial [Achromobacter xylosoxidans]|uniref:DUF802 domain-containing protein n=1 Tax=Alcaligenes xylosoxydans xylosoxydans TaxID=85698 RepID=UPI00211B11F1